MKKPNQRARDLLSPLHNPYAYASFDEAHDLQEESRHQGYLHLLQDPYASLGVTTFDDSKSRTWRSKDRKDGICSKGRFRKDSSRILRQYLPSEEKGKLRDNYKDFIDRNESQAPEIRLEILRQLQRYDLSSLRFTGLFNREKPTLTDDKLIQIEREVVEKQKK